MLVDKDVICPTDGLNQKFLVQKGRNDKTVVSLNAPITEEDLMIRILREVNVDYHIELLWKEINDEGQTVKDHFHHFSKIYFSGQKFPPIPNKVCMEFKAITL